MFNRLLEKSFVGAILLLIFLVPIACYIKPRPLNLTVETVPEPEPLHVAFVAISPEDERHPEIEKCFDYEPNIEFYDTTETYRLLKEHNIAADGLVDKRDLGYFKEMRDFTALILAIPRGGGVLLRSFRFQHERVVEGFIAKENLRCDALFNWMNFLKVVSFPDNALIFVDKLYYGHTPRWIQLPHGKHTIQVETLEEVIAKQDLTIPGKILIQLQKKD